MADNDWEISIFVPGRAAPASTDRLPDAAEEHSVGDWIPGLSRVEENVPVDTSQWEATITRLLQLSSNIGAKAKDWTMDELEVGFTLSAKGKLLFLAEAGGQASIKAKLKRKSSTS